MKTAEDIPNISIDHEEKIHIKDEIKQEIKSEPFGEEVGGIHEDMNDDIIKRANDVSGTICFDHEDISQIKEEIKQETRQAGVFTRRFRQSSSLAENQQEFIM